MATLSEALALALQRHQSGDLQAAEQIYRQILAADPNQADAHHLLGVIALQTGQLPQAVACFRRALDLKPNDAEALKNLSETLQTLGQPGDSLASFGEAPAQPPESAEALSNLGNAYLTQGKHNEAIDSYRRAIALKPDYPIAHYNLAAAFKRVGRLDEAVDSYRQALQLKPDFPESWHNLGRIFEAQGKFDEAAACFRRAIQLNPNLSEAYNNLGNVLCVQGRPTEALPYYRRSVELKPDLPEAYINLGNAFRALGKLDDAIVFCRHALQLNPSSFEAYNNLGNVYQTQGDLPAAIDCYRRAAELNPDDADAHSNLGSALQEQGQLAGAKASYTHALQRNPNCAGAHYGLATFNLLHGHFEAGWPEFEWRWQTNQLGPREFTFPGRPKEPVPRWDGKPLAGRTILLHAEEMQGGLGDTIQFVRYAALIKKQNPAATIIVECQRSLAKLLARCPGIDRLIPHGDELPPIHVHSPLMSLPGILKTSLPTIPAEIPYGFAAPALVDEWRKKLEPVRGLRIGINWRARPITHTRNIPIECFKRLAELPGVNLISLQKGSQHELSAGHKNDLFLVDLGDDFDTAHGAFMDTAAVMMNLDLVISSDTAFPHLAGALGVPVWLALSVIPDWRWLLDRPNSPWYPTIRLFRQKTHGDWNGVFDEIRAALHSLLSSAH